MRRISTCIWICVALFVFVTGVAAQDEPEPESADVVATIEAIATEVSQTAVDAQAAADDAARNNDLAFNLLGIFEAISLSITVAGAALGAFGFVRLISAQSSLTEAREQAEEEVKELRRSIEEDLELRRRDFNKLEAEVTTMVEQQRSEAAQATLATAMLSFGERQYRASDYVGAVNTYRRALELDNNNPITYYRLGYVLNSQGDLTEAEKQLLRSLEIDEKFAPAMVALGFVYRRMGEKMERGPERDQMLNRAEKYMLDGLQISPKLIDDDGESWYGALGGLYRRRGQIEQAVYAYEQATGVTPHSSYPFGNLAMLYGEQRNVDGMLRMYQRVEKLAYAEVQAEVDNYWGYFDLLTARLALNKAEKAEEVLPSVLETVPNDANYAYDSLLSTLGKVRDALEGYEQAATIGQFSERIKRYAIERKASDSKVPAMLRPESTGTFEAIAAAASSDSQPEDATETPEGEST